MGSYHAALAFTPTLLPHVLLRRRSSPLLPRSYQPPVLALVRRTPLRRPRSSPGDDSGNPKRSTLRRKSPSNLARFSVELEQSPSIAPAPLASIKALLVPPSLSPLRKLHNPLALPSPLEPTPHLVQLDLPRSRSPPHPPSIHPPRPRRSRRSRIALPPPSSSRTASRRVIGQQRCSGTSLRVG